MSFKVAEEIQRIRYEHYEDRRNQLIWQIDNAMKVGYNLFISKGTEFQFSHKPSNSY